MAHQMTGFEEISKPMSAPSAVMLELPDTIREHRVMVSIAEWLAARYPWQLATATQVRRRLLDEAA